MRRCGDGKLDAWFGGGDEGAANGFGGGEGWCFWSLCLGCGEGTAGW